MKIMITGGVKSGKSRYALSLARSMWDKKTFLATATALDDEMRERIRKHRTERGPDFATIEEPVEIHKHTGNHLILDCVTVWINNILYYQREEEWETILHEFLCGLGPDAIIVTNETGLGNIPENPLARHYNRLLGMANGLIAEQMDQVYLMVSNIPVKIKG